MELKEYLRIIKRRFYLIIITLVGALTVFSFHQKKEKPIYRSVVEIAIKKPQRYVILTGQIPALTETLSYETKLKLILNPAVLKLAIDIAKKSYKANKLPYLSDNINKAWEELREMVSYKQVEGTEIVKIAVTAGDPHFTMVMANSIATAFQDFNQKEFTKIKDETLKYIKKKKQELVTKRRSKYKELAKLGKIELLEYILSTASAEIKKLNDFKEKLEVVKLEINKIDEKISNYAQALENEDYELILQEAQIKPSKEETELEDYLRKIEEQLIEARATKTEFNPEVIALLSKKEKIENNINELKRKIKKENILKAKLYVMDRIKELNEKKSILVAEANTLKKKLASQEKIVENEVYNELPESLKGKDLDSLEFRKKFYHLTREEQENIKAISSEINALSAELDKLLQDERNLQMQVKLRGETIEIINAAELGKAIPVSSSKNWLIAVIIGLILGLTSAYLAEYFTITVRTEYDVRRYSNLPVLGVIPKFSRKEIVSLVDETRYTPLGETYNTIATLLEAYAVENKAKVFLVTSPGVGQGKSTIAVNLASALAKGKEKVAVVDFDLRKANLHNILKLKPLHKLTDYLSAKDPDLEVAHLLIPSSIENLYLIPTSAVKENTLSLIKSERCAKLFSYLREVADVIVVDTPPTNFAADAIVLSKYVDSVLLVIAAGEVAKDELRYSKHLLNSVGAKIAGVILNKATIESGTYYYYYYSKYYPKYYYGYGEKE